MSAPALRALSGCVGDWNAICYVVFTAVVRPSCFDEIESFCGCVVKFNDFSSHFVPVELSILIAPQINVALVVVWAHTRNWVEAN